jgi:hypothetical protein
MWGRGHTRDVCPSRSERSHNASAAQQQPAPAPDFFGRAFFGFSERVTQEDIDFLLNQDSPIVDDVLPEDLPDLVTDSDSEDDDDFSYSNLAPAVVDNAFPTDVPVNSNLAPAVVDNAFPTDVPVNSNLAPAVVDNAFPTDVPDLVSDSDSDDEDSYSSTLPTKSDDLFPSAFMVSSFNDLFQPQPLSSLYVNSKFISSHSSFVASPLEIVVDSGCSSHMVPDNFPLSDETPTNTAVHFGVSSSHSVSVGNGSVSTSFGHSLDFTTAIKVRGLNVVLLSVSKLFADGYIPVLKQDGGKFIEGN